MKVYLDTNVLVAAFATRGLCADVLHATLAEHQLIVGEVVLSELRRILRKKLRLPVDSVTAVDDFLRTQASLAPPGPLLGIKIQDKDDLAILSEAVAGAADVLVTGDGDLLAIAVKATLPIVTPRGLWELLRSNPDAK